MIRNISRGQWWIEEVNGDKQSFFIKCFIKNKSFKERRKCGMYTCKLSQLIVTNCLELTYNTTYPLCCRVLFFKVMLTGTQQPMGRGKTPGTQPLQRNRGVPVTMTLSAQRDTVVKCRRTKILRIQASVDNSLIEGCALLISSSFLL